MKNIVPLTFGPGGERIGEVEVDWENGMATGVIGTMRFDNPRDAKIMADLVQGKVIDSLSIEPNSQAMSVIPVLPPEMRDALGVEFVPQRIRYPRSLLDNTDEKHIVKGEH